MMSTAKRAGSKPKKEQEVEFKIEHLFGSKTRVKLLSLLLDVPDRAYYVRELTRKIDAQLNSVRRELQNLIELGIVLEVDGKILENEVDGVAGMKGDDKKKFYKANQAFVFFDELRSIMKKSAVLANRSFVEEVTHEGTIDYLCLTGRFVDNPSIPSDVLIVGSISAPKLRDAIDRFELEIGREINYTFMPKEEYYYRLEVKDRFLESLLKGENIVLVDRLS